MIPVTIVVVLYKIIANTELVNTEQLFLGEMQGWVSGSF
jgi:hypothetical protein